MNPTRFPINETLENMVDKYLDEVIDGPRDRELYEQIREDYLMTIENYPDYIGLTSWTEEILSNSDVSINDDMTQIVFSIPHNLIKRKQDEESIRKLFDSIERSARRYRMTVDAESVNLSFIFDSNDDAFDIPLFYIMEHKLEVYRPNMVLYNMDERY